MSIKEILDIIGGVFEYFLPLIFGFATLALQTKNFEDEYDQKIKEISIVYDNKFEAVTPEETKRFDRLSFDILLLRKQKEIYEDKLRCDCPICQEKTVSHYIEEYRSCKNIKEKNPIYKWSRLHEIFASNSEFQIGKNFIRSQEFDYYLEPKRSVQNFLLGLI